MLTDLGVEYVVVGHSERRQYFAETDETVNKRAKAALAGGLKPIICVGESLTQREQGVTEELIRMQVKIALNGVTADELKNVVIAYEPIWAIGTGKTATADQAEEVCAAIRKVVGELYGADAAKALTVQYGGSMNPKNAEELLSKPDVDGGLIGGASLKAPDFAVIVNAATKGYIDNPNFGLHGRAKISCWDLMQLLNEAAKQSYIDKFLERNQNATDFAVGIQKALRGEDTENYGWFLR